MALKKSKSKSKGCLLILVFLLLGGIWAAQQKIYYLREHSGFTQLLGDDSSVYLLIGTTKMGDETRLLTQLASLFQWQPGGVQQRNQVSVYRFSPDGFERGVMTDMEVRGSFFVIQGRLVYLKHQSQHEEWRPVWVWSAQGWQPMPQTQADIVNRAYARVHDRKAQGLSIPDDYISISHDSLWSREETRIALRGQLFSFKTLIQASAADSSRQHIRLWVEGLYGFKQFILEQDQAWKAVSQYEYFNTFFPDLAQ